MTTSQAAERQIIRQLLRGEPERCGLRTEQLITALALGAGLLTLLALTPELFWVCFGASLLVSLGLR